MDFLAIGIVIAALLVAARRGVGSRGVWFFLAVVGFLALLGSAFILELVEASRKVPEAPSRQILGLELFLPDAEDFSGRTTRFLGGLVVAFLLAGFFHRTIPSRAPVSASQPPGDPFGKEARPLREPSRLTLSQREVQGVVILDLAGRLTLGPECDSLRMKVRELLNAGRKKLLLNLGEVTRVDSAGIGILVESVVLTANEGGHLRLFNVPPLVQGSLTVHRLLSAFEIYPSENDAVASFSA